METQSCTQSNACSRVEIGIIFGGIENKFWGFGCCAHDPKSDRLKTEVHSADLVNKHSTIKIFNYIEYARRLIKPKGICDI